MDGAGVRGEMVACDEGALRRAKSTIMSAWERVGEMRAARSDVRWMDFACWCGEIDGRKARKLSVGVEIFEDQV